MSLARITLESIVKGTFEPVRIPGDVLAHLVRMDKKHGRVLRAELARDKARRPGVDLKDRKAEVAARLMARAYPDRTPDAAN